LQDIKNSFYSFGELRGITMVPKQGCAFVQFTQVSPLLLSSVHHPLLLILRYSSPLLSSPLPTSPYLTTTPPHHHLTSLSQRKSAEKAAEGTFNKLLIRGNKITIRSDIVPPLDPHFLSGKSLHITIT